MRAILLALVLFPLVLALDSSGRGRGEGPPARPVEVASFPHPPPFQLVGFTSATSPSDAGVLGLTLACQAEFPRSRLCSSVEVMDTLEVPELAGDPAWVRPVLVPGEDTLQNDASGVASRARGLSCNGWTGPGFGFTPERGLTVSAAGQFSAMGCDVARPVSCCAPVGPRR